MSETEVQTLEARSHDEMLALGRRLARNLPAGALVVLTGPLGAGKTVFVRGMAEGLGIDPACVRSPSFTLVNEYGPAAGGRRLIHLDLYRLESEGEVEELGLGDYLDGDRVVAVEWGEKLPARLRAGAIAVSIEDTGGDTRRVTIRSYSSPSQ